MKRGSVGTGLYILGPNTKKPVPFDECLKKIKGLGFDGLEIGAWPPHPTPQEYNTTEKRAAHPKKIADPGVGTAGLAIDIQRHLTPPVHEDTAIPPTEKNPKS